MSKRNYVLIAAVLPLIAAKVIEVAVTLNSWAHYVTLMAEIGLPFTPTMRLAFAGFWALALVILALDLWRKRAWARWWAAPLLTLYGATHWLWQALFVRAEFDRGRLGFQATITLVVLLPVWVIAWRRGWLRRDGW